MDAQAEPVREEELVRYLLGELPEEEQVRLEERAFTDPGLTAEILAAECDLIDEYVRGELSDEQRRRFESRFVTSAPRRRKLEFARAFAQAASAARESEQPARLRGWRRWLSVLRGPTPALRFATAATLLLLLGLSWLVAERVRLRSQVDQLQADLEALRGQDETLRGEAAEARARSVDLSDQLERERRRLAELAEKGVGDRARGVSAGASALAVFFLPPGVGRGAAGLPQFVLPESTTAQAGLQVGLEPEDDYASFQVELGTLAGEQVWTRSGLRSRPSAAGPVLDLTLPGGVLEAGEYELKLRGLNEAGSAEDVRYYYFEVLTN